jgi:biopolymer transport protein TolQ
MSTDLSYLHLVLGASHMVQFVMGILLIASIASWTMIISRRVELKRARSARCAWL